MTKNQRQPVLRGRKVECHARRLRSYHYHGQKDPFYEADNTKLPKRKIESGKSKRKCQTAESRTSVN